MFFKYSYKVDVRDWAAQANSKVMLLDHTIRHTPIPGEMAPFGLTIENVARFAFYD